MQDWEIVILFLPETARNLKEMCWYLRSFLFFIANSVFCFYNDNVIFKNKVFYFVSNQYWSLNKIKDNFNYLMNILAFPR